MILRLRKQNEYTRFYILLVILLVLLFIRYGLQIGIPRAAFTVVIALIALLGDQNEILAISMGCIPLQESIDFFFSLVTCAAVYALKNHSRIRINLAAILVIFMICWELLHCFDAAFSLVTFLTTIVPLIFLAVILCAELSEMDYDFIVRMMATVSAATGIILLVNLIVQANFNFTSALAGLRRLGMISEDSESSAMLGSAVNPNTLGIICVLSTTGLLQLRTIERSKKTDILLMLILLVFGTLTSSRTFLACLVLMAVLLILGQPGDIRKRVRFLGSLVLFALLALFLLNWLFPDLLQYFGRRLQGDNIMSSRDTLLIAYNRYISSNPDVMFFGNGLHNYRTKLIEVYRVARNVPHNGIQEIIIAWGVPGLILFALLFSMMILQSRKYSKRQTLLNYIPLIIILAKSMAGQLLTSPYTILALSYAYLSLVQDFGVREKKRT